MSSTNGMGPMPDDDTIPIQISDTVARGTVKPTYPVIRVPAHVGTHGGDAIANGFVYRGKLVPALRDKLVFGDITTGRIWYADRADVLAADDGNPTTVAPIHEMDAGLRRLTEETYRARGGKGEALPGDGRVCRPRPRGPAVRGRQRRRALHPDQERRHDQEGRGRQGRDDRRRPRRARPLRVASQSVTSQSAASAHESRRVHARVDRRREAGLRRQLRRLSRQRGARRGESRHRPSRSSRSSAASSRRTSPTTNGITARATARSSPSSSAACRRR